MPSSAPLLTRTEQLRLARDGEVQRKDRRGRGGQCVHVVETDAPLDDVCQRQLRDVDGWANLMRASKRQKRGMARRDDAHLPFFGDEVSVTVRLGAGGGDR